MIGHPFPVRFNIRRDDHVPVISETTERSDPGAIEGGNATKERHAPPGHTIVVEDAVRMVEFSPHDQMSAVLAHVVAKL